MTSSDNCVAELRESFRSQADSDVGLGAAAYMRNQFEFLGMKTPLRRELSKTMVSQSRALSERDLVLLCKELWAQPEREFQYVACDLLAKNASRLSPE